MREISLRLKLTGLFMVGNCSERFELLIKLLTLSGILKIKPPVLEAMIFWEIKENLTPLYLFVFFLAADYSDLT